MAGSGHEMESPVHDFEKLIQSSTKLISHLVECRKFTDKSLGRFLVLRRSCRINLNSDELLR